MRCTCHCSALPSEHAARSVARFHSRRCVIQRQGTRQQTNQPPLRCNAPMPAHRRRPAWVPPPRCPPPPARATPWTRRATCCTSTTPSTSRASTRRSTSRWCTAGSAPGLRRAKSSPSARTTWWRGGTRWGCSAAAVAGVECWAAFVWTVCVHVSCYCCTALACRDLLLPRCPIRMPGLLFVELNFLAVASWSSHVLLAPVHPRR